MVVGSMLAMAFGAAPSVLASTPGSIDLASGVDSVSYSIPSIPAAGAAVLVSPDSLYGSIPGARWINTTGATGGDQGSNMTTVYSVPFTLPPGFSSPSISVHALADNAATVLINDVQIGQQPQASNYANFDGTATWTFSWSTYSDFHVGANTLSIANLDLGGRNGIDFAATVTYGTGHLVLSPADPSIVAGTTQAFTAELFDDADTDLGDVTDTTTFTIDGRPCTLASCGSTVAGLHTIAATDGIATGQTTLTVSPAAVDHFNVDTAIPDQTAGTAFQSAPATPLPVAMTAYDTYGNVKTDYAPAAGHPTYGGLAASPGCASCSPPIASHAASYGSGTWAGGHVTLAGITAYRTGSGIHLTVADGSASGSSTGFTVGPAGLAGFTVDTVIPDQTAGTAFPIVSMTAHDEFGNVKTDYGGSAALSGLAVSPGCPAPSCSPAIPAASPSYGTRAILDGHITFSSITAFNSQTGARLTVKDGSVSNVSDAFTVNPAGATKLVFSDTAAGFAGQPIDTKVSTPIYSVCGPAPAGATNQCAVPPSSTPVKVLAIDAYGNRVSGVGVTIGASPSVTVGAGNTGTSVGGTPGVAPFGEISFSTLSIATAGTYRLTASAAGGVSGLSNQFNVVGAALCRLPGSKPHEPGDRHPGAAVLEDHRKKLEPRRARVGQRPADHVVLAGVGHRQHGLERPGIHSPSPDGRTPRTNQGLAGRHGGTHPSAPGRGSRS